MRWQDIDEELEWWTLPEFVKNRQAHRVYLNAKAQEIIKAIPRTSKSIWLFPLSEMGDVKHVANRLAVESRANIQDFGGHDLRRTAATYMTSAGVSRFVISRVLNHAEQGVTAIYDRASYDGEKRAALAFWDRQLGAILNSKPASSVGRFHM